MTTGKDASPIDTRGANDDHIRIAPAGGGEAPTILVADDDEDDRILVSDALREAGFLNPLRFVRNGEELMNHLHRRGEYASLPLTPYPGLLLLDLNMPRKDGREALKEIKRDPQLRSIPVVVLTTSYTQEDVDLVYSLGGNSFVSKPVTFVGLVKVLKIVGDYWFQVVKLPGAPL
jgi:CheY-like chemotaxis protein